MNDAQLKREFEQWWSVVWRRVAKGAALKAFRTARKEVDLSVLTKGAKDFGVWLSTAKKSRSKVRQNFWPHPATWLNQGRWDDDLTMPEVETTPLYGKSEFNVDHERTAFEYERQRSAKALEWLNAKPGPDVAKAFERFKVSKGVAASNIFRSVGWDSFPVLVAREMGWNG